MIFDVFLSEHAEMFRQGLNAEERDAFETALLDVLCSDPYPDGVSKIALDDFPYQPGTIGFAYGDFWFTYRFHNETTLRVTQAVWRPSSPRSRPI